DSVLNISDPPDANAIPKKPAGSGGNIFIRSSTLTFAEGFLEATNFGDGPGGQVSLRGDSEITLSKGAAIHSLAAGAGRGPDIILTTGPAGNISASTGALVDVGSASVRLVGGQFSSGSGAPGQLTVRTGTLTLTSGAIFGSDVRG